MLSRSYTALNAVFAHYRLPKRSKACCANRALPGLEKRRCRLIQYNGLQIVCDEGYHVVGNRRCYAEARQCTTTAGTNMACSDWKAISTRKGAALKWTLNKSSTSASWTFVNPRVMVQHERNHHPEAAQFQLNVSNAGLLSLFFILLNVTLRMEEVPFARVLGPGYRRVA